MTKLEEAERRLDDSIKNGTDDDIQYWRGYCDAVKAMELPNAPLTLNELQGMDEPFEDYNYGETWLAYRRKLEEA